MGQSGKRLGVVSSVFFITFLIAPHAADAQSPAGDNVQERLSALEAGQKHIQESLQRLESKLDQLAASPSEFSRVVVQVRSGDAKPLSVTVTQRNAVGQSYRIEVPAGDVKVAVVDLLGQASPELQQVLGADSAEEHSIWLNVNLRNDSQWIDRMFDENGWKRSESAGELLTQTIALQEDEKQAVVLASP